MSQWVKGGALLARTRVRCPAHTSGGSQLLVTLVPGGLMLLILTLFRRRNMRIFKIIKVNL